VSEFGPAIAITLAHEGGYAFVPATGECVNMGLTHWFLRSIGYLGDPPASGPVTESEKATIRGLSESLAKGLYQEYFWKRYRCGEFDNQDIANKYFDLCVNTGPRETCTILQRAINSLSHSLVEDGLIGTVTLAAANECDPVTLLAEIREQAEDFYRALAKEKPELANRLDGWLVRLNS
jgi:lysozyme family protein